MLGWAWLAGQDGDPEAEDPERGSATVAVTAFGLLAVMVVLSLASAMVVEFRNVEDSLAQVRAYWAAQGQANYVLSRMRQSSPCDKQSCPGDGKPSPAAIQNYLKEVQAALGATLNGGTTARWLYPEVGANYSFYVTGSANADSAAPKWTTGSLVGQTKAGEYCLRFTFDPYYVAATGAPTPKGAGNCQPGTTGTPPAPVDAKGNSPVTALRIIPQLRPVEVRFCAVGNATVPCGCTTPNSGPSCNAATGFDSTLPYQHVTSVHRPVK